MVVVTVDIFDIEAERSQFFGKAIDGHDALHAVHGLETVVVDDDREVVKSVVCGSHEAFPYRALLALAITEHDIDVVALPIHLARERDTDGV